LKPGLNPTYKKSIKFFFIHTKFSVFL
jgi:hypothetical protein